MSYLLDTGLLIHVIRNSTVFQRIDEEINLTKGGFRPVTSIISQGELLGLAYKNNWGSEKLSRLNALFEEIVVLPVDRPTIANAYTELESLNIKRGLNLGQNDLWIAATATVYRLTVLTFDADFDRAPDSVAHIRYDQNSGFGSDLNRVFLTKISTGSAGVGF